MKFTSICLSVGAVSAAAAVAPKVATATVKDDPCFQNQMALQKYWQANDACE